MKRYWIILAASSLSVISIKTILTDINELWMYGHEVGEIIYDLGLAISFTAVLYLFQLNRYRIVLNKRFDNRIFECFYKEHLSVGAPVYSIRFSVEQNVIKFYGSKNTDDKDPFIGEIVMNPINLKMGDGFHHHLKSEAYGFIRIIIKDPDTLFVDAPYTKMDDRGVGTVVPQAFVWRLKK